MDGVTDCSRVKTYYVFRSLLWAALPAWLRSEQRSPKTKPYGNNTEQSQHETVLGIHFTPVMWYNAAISIESRAIYTITNIFFFAITCSNKLFAIWPGTCIKQTKKVHMVNLTAQIRWMISQLSHSCLFGYLAQIDIFSQQQVLTEAGQHRPPLLLRQALYRHLVHKRCHHIWGQLSLAAHRPHHNHAAEAEEKVRLGDIPVKFTFPYFSLCCRRLACWHLTWHEQLLWAGRGWTWPWSLSQCRPVVGRAAAGFLATKHMGDGALLSQRQTSS